MVPPEPSQLPGVAESATARDRLHRQGRIAAKSARQLMREQLADNTTDFAATPQYIIPPGCHQGGSFDLHLDGGHFP